MAHHTVLLALLLAFCATANALDSEGTNFVFAFVRNANAANISSQVLTASVLNQNAQDCMFTLTYRADYHKSTPPQNMTVTAPKMGSIQIVIPNWYGWNYASESVQNDVFLTLMGFSTCPVTLLANNYDMKTGQGDTFMVLPTTWGSKSFTFSLPPAVTSAEQQYEQVFVLPTTDGSTRVNVVEIGNAQSVYSFNVTYGNAPAVYIGARTPDKRPRTYHVTSDKDVLIVAGVTCAGADVSTCDHAAYMPHPPPASDCYAYDYYDDDHVSYLPTTAQFFADIPGSCYVGQNITSTLNDGVSQTITIKPQMESPLWTIQTTTAAQLGVAFHNGGSNIHIARYYDGTKYNVRGAFVATSPSVTQFHNANTAFYTRNPNDSLEIYCNVLACAAITIDGTKIVIADTKVVQKVDGISYYIFVITIPNAGFHQISLSQKGEYSFFVFGKNNQYSYGYEGGVNKPTFVLAPPTTPGPTFSPPPTQTTLTPPATVTTQTLPTTATPPASLSTASPTTPGTMTPATSTVVSTAPTNPSTNPPVTTQTTATPAQTPAPTSATTVTIPITVTTAPVPSTATTNTPIVATSTTKPPVVTTQTSPTLPPQTSSPTMPTTVAITTASQSTVGSTATTPSQAPVTGTTQTPAVVVTTTTITTTTVTVPITTATTTKPTQPVVTTTAAIPVTTTATVPVTTKTTPKAIPTTTTTTTTTTTQTPSTSTQSSSVVSIVLPVAVTILFSLLF